MIIQPLKQARTEVIKAIMEPWMPGKMIAFEELARSLNVLNVTQSNRKLLSVMLYTYKNHNGHMLWDENSLVILKILLKDILNITDKKLNEIIKTGDSNLLIKEIADNTKGLELSEINEICFILTKED